MGRKRDQPQLRPWEFLEDALPFFQLSDDALTAMVEIARKDKSFYTAIPLYERLLLHSRTDINKKCLYNTLLYVYNQLGENKTKQEINDIIESNKRAGYYCPYFVFPQKQAASYGYSQSRSQSLLKILQGAGFIEIYWSGRYTKKPSIYKFSDKWKK